MIYAFADRVQISNFAPCHGRLTLNLDRTMTFATLVSPLASQSTLLASFSSRRPIESAGAARDLKRDVMSHRI